MIDVKASLAAETFLLGDCIFAMSNREAALSPEGHCSRHAQRAL
jgi:hypothetical protein